MININKSNHVKNNKKSSNRKNLGYTLMLTGLLSINSPAEAKTWNIVDSNEPSVEVVDNSTILNNIERMTGIALPGEYANKLKDFIVTNKVMKSNNGAKFTENFIVNQMKSNWGISKENQLVFVWSAVYKQITNNDLYDGSDGDDNRLDEFSNVIDNIEQCGNEYVTGFNSYMERGSAEARQQSAEARQQSAEARQQSAEARQQSAEARQQSAEARQQSAEAKQEIISGLNESLNLLKEFYTSYKQSPNYEDLKKFKANAKEIIPLCKKYNVDYKAKLSKEMLKFYGVE